VESPVALVAEGHLVVLVRPETDLASRAVGAAPVERAQERKLVGSVLVAAGVI